jgi:uncharacterized membrane protein
VPNDDRISIGETLLWGSLGIFTGLVAGIVVSEWIGDVNRPRIRRVAARLQQPAPVSSLTAAARARSAGAALQAHAALRDLGLQAVAVSQSTVELRGWVASRSTRALAARVARGVPGVEMIINNILVRGEDDLAVPTDEPSDLLA